MNEGKKNERKNKAQDTIERPPKRYKRDMQRGIGKKGRELGVCMHFYLFFFSPPFQSSEGKGSSIWVGGHFSRQANKKSTAPLFSPYTTAILQLTTYISFSLLALPSGCQVKC
jgi:hypothetical protein